jgi:hypothetical protein
MKDPTSLLKEGCPGLSGLKGERQPRKLKLWSSELSLVETQLSRIQGYLTVACVSATVEVKI